jgi:uroporphyrinogen decarboxylase
MELFCDLEIMLAVLHKKADQWQRTDYIEFQRVMGYDYLCAQGRFPEALFHHQEVAEANPDSLTRKRFFRSEQSGPIQSREDLESFHWPTVETTDYSDFDLFNRNLPKGMGIIATIGGYFENVSWSMGLQPFCYKLIDDRPFVKELFERWGRYCLDVSQAVMDQPNVAAYWLSDDLGFNSGPFMSPADLREFVFPVYAELGRMCRARRLPFILHSCGKLHAVMDDLIACGVNCLHSLPPNIYDLAEIKRTWGDRLSFAGNIDLNILGLGTTHQTRAAVREVKRVWRAEPPGGIILSSANTVANYSRVANYLAMMDELLA